jgi:GT2 family glycosyltransferase
VTEGPGVSVCVATYRRPRQLTRLLAHLAALDGPPQGFEVVVVDDGSPADAGIGAILAEEASRFPVALRWRSLPVNSGRAAARNAAWREATGEWVAFTDDDCRPDPKWLHHLLEAVAGGPGTVGIVQGRVAPDPDRAGLLSNPLARSLRVDKLSGYYETANIAYRRDALEAVGGFDDRFPGAGEDTDLGWRVRERGFEANFAPDALVVHDVEVRSFAEDLRDRRRWGDVVGVVKRHPGTRRLIWKPLVFRKSHVLPLLAIAGLPLCLVSPKTRAGYGAAMALGVVRRARRGRNRGGIWPELQVLAGDFYEVGVVLRANFEQRTVLL